MTKRKVYCDDRISPLKIGTYMTERKGYCDDRIIKNKCGAKLLNTKINVSLL